MKKLLMMAFAIIFSSAINAQFSDEWLRQKATQKKYLLQQIAALQVYSGYLSKGYKLVKTGLNTMQNIKHGDFNLHAYYFTSLLYVNPKIKSYSKVADIISIQIAIAKQTGRAIRRFSSSDHFTDAELIYVKKVVNSLLIDGAKNLDQLLNLISNGDLQMKDDERIKAIDGLYADMLDKQMFSRGFFNDAEGLSIQRASEENGIIISKKLNDTK